MQRPQAQAVPKPYLTRTAHMRETIPPQALDRARPQALDKSALPDIVTSESTEDGKSESGATAEA